MENRLSLWELHCLATAYGQRPSGILRISDEWAAYQLDVATLLVGREFEVAIRAGKEPRVKGRQAQVFQDARMMVTRRVRIPKSGVW